MVKLVHENTQLVFVFESAHELRVVHQLKLSGVRVDAHTSGRDRRGRGLVDPTRQGREEGLAHEQASGVHVQVEGRGGLVGHG